MNNQVPDQTPRLYSDDEISLVDLASTLVKRWKLMTAVFLVVMLGALAYALTTPRTYEYVTLYQVAEKAPSSDGSVVGTLEAPMTVLAKINNLYLGPVTRELIASNEMNALPFTISTSSLGNTNLVRLASATAASNSALVEQAHNMVLSRVQDEQKQLLERRRRNLEQELASAESGLESVKDSTNENAGELIALYADRVSNIQARMSQLGEGHVNQVAVQSLVPVGTSRSLIMALAIVLGGMLAVMVVFLTAFAGTVRKSLRDE